MHFNWNWLKYAGLINTGIIDIAYVSILLYGLYIIHQNRAHPSDKRCPQLFIFIGICVISLFILVAFIQLIATDMFTTEIEDTFLSLQTMIGSSVHPKYCKPYNTSCWPNSSEILSFSSDLVGEFLTSNDTEYYSYIMSSNIMEIYFL